MSPNPLLPAVIGKNYKCIGTADTICMA